MDTKIPRCSSPYYKMVWYLHLGYFHVLATVKSAAMNTGYMCLSEVWFSPESNFEGCVTDLQSSLICHVKSWRRSLFLFCWWGNWGSEKLQESPGVVKPLFDTGERKTQAGSPTNARLFSPKHFTHISELRSPLTKEQTPYFRKLRGPWEKVVLSGNSVQS